jgi:hypothetical protein
MANRLLEVMDVATKPLKRRDLRAFLCQEFHTLGAQAQCFDFGVIPESSKERFDFDLYPFPAPTLLA